MIPTGIIGGEWVNYQTVWLIFQLSILLVLWAWFSLGGKQRQFFSSFWTNF